jgi:integrase
MNRQVLNDRLIKALKSARPGKRYTRWDAIVPGLGLRVTDRGAKTFGVMKRIGDGAHPVWRAIDQYGAITLERAREIAREWLAQIKAGIDPRNTLSEKREAEAAKQTEAERAKLAVFSTVAEEFFAYMNKRGLRQAHRVETRIRNELLPHWGERSIHDICRDDVEDLIKDIVERPAPRYAHNVLDDMKMLFGFCVDVADRRAPYKLSTSPTDRIKPVKLIGKKAVRTRVLDDPELRSLWQATGTLGYAFGPLVRTLLLTGVRLNEGAGARWSEFDLTAKLWIIPPERFKSAVAHRVPLSASMLDLLEGLPRFQSGPCLFSSQHGKTPINGFGKPKARLDQLMGGIPPWSLHDIRRTLRTRLSALKVERHIAELVIGHGKKGLDRNYDQHQYEGEMREALERWAGLLQSIVEPPPSNVVALRA